MRTIKLFRANGEEKDLGDVKLSLKQMQEYVGGYIEGGQVLYNGVTCDALFNEEGKLVDEPAINHRVTEMYRALWGPVDWIAGDALIFVGGNSDSFFNGGA